ncbi:hypothetical protein BT67DRAFT_137269 [Trichocladium antarcticum]|uniref:PWWP domain-containing protein n=1 Tax=Trichocladium antarcticum TaxID=1450529 RepID=A0AAN6ZBM5_9PEZI|nr:hypothetical protein BT67DRAFT_137269 [Trichocladium antarcticum]
MSGDNEHNVATAEGAPPAVETKQAATTVAPVEASKEAPAAEAQADAAEPESAAEPAPAAKTSEESDGGAKKPAEKDTKMAEEKTDVEMADAAAPAEPTPDAADAADAAHAAHAAHATETAAPEQPGQAADAAPDATAADTDKSKSKHRKSIGGGESKGRKLNRKASKPRILHLDAQPGDHYYVKLKGHPQWPVIICDEDMLPASLLKSRPVTAKRADGTYREDFADGARKAADRTFPVMYLHTNEFGWVPNTDLIELDPKTVLDVKMDKMKKALQAAHHLAAKSHPLSHYKEVLQSYQEDLIEQEKARAAEEATATSKALNDDGEDFEMEDAPTGLETPAKSKKAKKRKAEDSVETPQRSESVKKPKIKLTTSATPKAANGAAASPKSAKAAQPKSAKSKAKKAKNAEEEEEEEAVVEKEDVAAKEPELSPEDRRVRKEKEVLFLRHKLQKGLLTRDQEPKEDEMKLMADYVTKLEAFPDLEVSIIRATKINKVLKAVLKLDTIPREDEFKFKPRSQVLLDKWNKLLAVDGTPAEVVNGTAPGTKSGARANGAKEKNEAAAAAAAEVVKAKAEAKAEAKVEAAEESREEPKETAKPDEAPAAVEKGAGAEEVRSGP